MAPKRSLSPLRFETTYLRGERGLRTLIRSWESTQSFQELDFTSNGFFFCTRCGAEKCFSAEATGA